MTTTSALAGSSLLTADVPHGAKLVQILLLGPQILHKNRPP
jgi:hypothetical protein